VNDPGSRPLAGARVLVPRPQTRTSGLAAALSLAGATVLAAPLIRTVPPADPTPLRSALDRLPDFDWVCFTSAAAVAAVAGLRPDVPCRIAAVGAGTAAAVARAGWRVDLVPDGAGSARALGEVFPPGPGSVLLPLSALAADTLADALAAKGWTVTRVDAYDTEIVPPAPDVAAALADGLFDAVVCTSGSTVAALDGVTIAPATALVAIGPSTAAALAAAGRPVAAVADSPDDAALLATLVRLHAGHPESGRSS
jgi:uroporphyrinogen-III synthase